MKVKDLLSKMNSADSVCIDVYAYGCLWARTYNDNIFTVEDCIANCNYTVMNSNVARVWYDLESEMMRINSSITD